MTLSVSLERVANNEELEYDEMSLICMLISIGAVLPDIVIPGTLEFSVVPIV